MTELHKALMGFWQQFGVPVFVAGAVDDQTPFPYITIDIGDGGVGSSTVMQATTWHRRKAEESMTVPMLERLTLLDNITRAFPPDGRFLVYEGGYAALYRNDANFISYVVDQADDDVIGGRVAYEIHFYNP